MVLLTWTAAEEVATPLSTAGTSFEKFAEFCCRLEPISKMLTLEENLRHTFLRCLKAWFLLRRTDRGLCQLLLTVTTLETSLKLFRVYFIVSFIVFEVIHCVREVETRFKRYIGAGSWRVVSG